MHTRSVCSVTLLTLVCFAGCQTGETQVDIAPKTNVDGTSVEAAPAVEPPKGRDGTGSPSGDGRGSPPGDGAPAAKDEDVVVASVADGQGSPKTVTEPPKTGTIVEDPVKSDCDKWLARHQELRKGIPLLFVDLVRTPDAIEKDVRASIRLAERFLEDCGDSSEAALLTAYLARDLLTLFDRYVEDLQAKTKKQLEESGVPEEERPAELKQIVEEESEKSLGRIRELAADSLAMAPGGDVARWVSLALNADLARKDENFQGQVEFATKLLEEFPDTQYRSKFLVDVGNALYFLGRVDEAAVWMEKVIDKHKGDRQYPTYLETYFYSLYSAGNLEGMEAVLNKMRSEYPARLAKERSRHYRSQYELWYDTSTFWLGFARYARGEIEGAKKAWREGIEYLEAKQKTLQAKGLALPSVPKIYLDFRYRKMLHFVEEYHGKEPVVIEDCQTAGTITTADLSEGIRWATEKKLTLKDAKGQAVGVLFRLPGNQMAETFLLELNELNREAEGIAAVTLGYLPRKFDEAKVEKRLENMRREHRELELDMPGGFDESPNWCVFRSAFGLVGTPSFAAFDRKGRFAWYLQDPRDRDRMIMVRLLERLAAEKD